MKVIADICVVPFTGKVSVRQEVAVAHQILAETGCPVMLHGFGTNIEGDFDLVMAALKRVHETLHQRGAARVHTTIRLGSRTDKAQGIQDKIDAVEGEATS
ncbi:MAG: thiamine-binding protein [Planctomycetota bacterium]|nr:MAG: thiamine-binding protein [Planctomycetota bacterium]